jgi:hypothetical protein
MGDFAKVLQNILSASDDVSKVVDENGEPIVAYHGTPHPGFSVFNTLGRFRGRHSTSRNTGVYATDDRSLAYIYTSRTEYENKNDYTFSDWDGVGQVYSLYMNLKNPLVIECNGADYDEIRFGGRKTSTDAIVRKLRKGGFGNGYDGVVFKNVYDGGYTTDYVTLSPNQIKSATDNVGTFDANNNDIRFQFVGEKGAANADHAEEVTTFDTYKGEEAKQKLNTILSRSVKRNLPSKISTLEHFKKVFAAPIHTMFNEIVEV